MWDRRTRQRHFFHRFARRFSLDFRPAKRLEGWINAPNNQRLRKATTQKGVDDNERQSYSDNDQRQDRER